MDGRDGQFDMLEQNREASDAFRIFLAQKSPTIWLGFLVLCI